MKKVFIIALFAFGSLSLVAQNGQSRSQGKSKHKNTQSSSSTTDQSGTGTNQSGSGTDNTGSSSVQKDRGMHKGSHQGQTMKRKHRSSRSTGSKTTGSGTSDNGTNGSTPNQ